MTDKVISEALRYFEGDYNCAQSVLKAILEKYDRYYDEGTASVAGLGGGVGLQGDVCGAVSGAVVALGVLNSRKIKDAKKHKEETYASAAKFSYKFKKKFDTVICSQLTGINMTDTEARDEAIKSGAFRKLCPKFVEEAVRITLDMASKS